VNKTLPCDFVDGWKKCDASTFLLDREEEKKKKKQGWRPIATAP